MIGARTVLCHRWLLGLAIASAVLSGASVVGVGRASAQTFDVTETTGPKGLVEAVAKANADGEANTIVLAGGTYVPFSTLTFTNTAGLQTIEGPASPPAATVTGGSVTPFPSELLVVKAGVSLTVKDVSLTLGGGLGVPAIVDSGNLTFEASTVSGDKGPQVIVEQVGTATAHNSTISDGSDFGVIDRGTASFFNSTVAFNKNGGIENTGTLNLTNTFVAQNTGSGDCTAAATTSDHSLDSDGSCGVGALSKMNSLLQKELRNDGGSMPVHTEKPGSPGIDAGDTAACPPTDEVGHPRPDVSGTACDIGADEYNEVKPTLKLPANITTPATSPEGAEVHYTVEASTSLSVIRSIECVNEKNLPAPSGSLFPVGTTTLTCTATDGHENKTSGSFTVTVTPQVIATAPTVETKPAGSLTTTTATLNATVNPNGSEVSECTFEYGTTTAYGKTAPCSPAPGAGTSPAAVSAAITGLSPNTTYDFRVLAKNAGGTTDGANETFKTEAEIVLPPPPTVETKPAGSLTTTTATLNATVNPNGGEVSECTFEYGTTTAYGKTAPCSPAPGAGTSPAAVSAAITGLSPNTTYDFRVLAKNAGGTTDGANETFKTEAEIVLPPPPTVETKPAGSLTTTTATLNATVNPNGSEVSECTFEYGTTTAYGKTASCSPAPGAGTSPAAVSAAITGLSPNTTYDFRVLAKNAGGTTDGANETFKTLEEVKEVLPAAEAIERLLDEVNTSGIRHEIRAKLSRLLSEALRDLERPGGVGSQTSAGTEGPMNLALRAGGESSDGRGHGHGGEHACRALEKFIDVITDDQNRRRPEIPADLASAWVPAAQGIEASLECPADDQWDHSEHR